MIIQTSLKEMEELQDKKAIKYIGTVTFLAQYVKCYEEEEGITVYKAKGYYRRFRVKFKHIPYYIQCKAIAIIENDNGKDWVDLRSNTINNIFDFIGVNDSILWTAGKNRVTADIEEIYNNDITTDMIQNIYLV